MKKRICVISGSRAEFGLLLPVIKRIQEDDYLELVFLVTGSHLSKSFGNTIDEIRKENIHVDYEIKLNLEGDKKVDMAKAIGEAINLFADYFSKEKVDIVLVLGDRYEIFAASISAAMLGIPIAHLCGGETTEGAVDEFIRHSITKMSYLHFVTCEEYRRRVIQLGESPDRVFNVGGLGIENVLKIDKLSKDELSIDLGIDLSRPYSVVTFHPVTMSNDNIESQVNELVKALEAYPQYSYVFTKANADAGGRIINTILERECKKHELWYLFDSLGVRRYISLLGNAIMLIGNSSSGMAEAPALGVPTVNIGDRQKGRITLPSIINCECEEQGIVDAIKKATLLDANAIKDSTKVFGTGNTSYLIVETIKSFLKQNKIELKKSFYDIKR